MQRGLLAEKNLWTQDSHMCYLKWKDLLAQLQKKHFQFLQKLPQKPAFSSNQSNTKFLKFSENQNPQTISEAEAAEDSALSAPAAAPGGMDCRRWIWLPAAEAKVSQGLTG